jgi:hypothetical protein
MHSPNSITVSLVVSFIYASSDVEQATIDEVSGTEGL